MANESKTTKAKFNYTKPVTVKSVPYAISRSAIDKSLKKVIKESKDA